MADTSRRSAPRASILLPFLVAALAALPCACGGGGKSVDQPVATVAGEVTSTGGAPLQDVQVTRVGGAGSGATDAGGRVTLTLPTGVELVLRLTRSGFVDRLEPMTLPAGASSGAFSAVLLPREPAIAIAGIEAGGTATGKHGTRVTFPAGALVTGAGQPVSGAVEVTLTPIDVSSGEALAFPGAYQGVPQGGSRAPIVSFGAADFEVTQAGARLGFAPGAAAAIQIPLYATRNQDGSAVAAGQHIPLWSLDPQTGIWRQEGLAEVVASPGSPTGLAARATVTHFTPWNLDQVADYPGSFQATPVKCVIGASGDLPQRDLPAGTSCTVKFTVGDEASPTEVRTETIPPQGTAGPLPAGVPIRLDGRARVSGALLRGLLQVTLEPGGSGPLLVVLDPANAPPTASAGPDATVEVGATVQLDGSGSRDPDGDPLTYAWTLGTRPAGSSAELTGATTSSPTFVADVAGSYVAQLVVHDGKVASAPDTARIMAQSLLPVVTIEATSPHTDETGELLGIFTVTRTGPTADALAVAFTVGGTATAALDYYDIGSSVTIPAGQPSATVSVLPFGDGLVEGLETVVLTLLDGAAYDLGVPASATVDIADGVIRVNEVQVVASDALAAEEGSDPGTFTITRTGVVALPLEVGFAIGGTATAGADYGAIPAAVTFLAGEWSVALAVTPIPDALAEGSETVVLTLVAGTGYVLGASSSATIAIGDTALAAVTVTASDSAASEPGSNAGAFTLARTGSTAGALEVSVTPGGTATAGDDYQALPATVTIPAGAPTATVTVTPIDDTSAEGSETVTLAVAPGAGYVVGNPAQATVTIADNDPPVVTIQATDPSASEAGGDPGVFTISRTGPTTAWLRIPFAVGGTASNGTDYLTIGAEVAILSGQASATVTISPMADQSAEASETVVLILALDLTGGYHLGSPSQATVTIADATPVP